MNGEKESELDRITREQEEAKKMAEKAEKPDTNVKVEEAAKNGSVSAMEAELVQIEKMRKEHKDELEASFKSTKETWDAFFADPENKKFIEPTNLPTYLWWVIIGFAGISYGAVVLFSDNSIWKIIAGVDSILNLLIIIFGLRTLDAPNQAVVECFGKPYAIWGAGLHILIPGIMEMRSPTPIGSNIPIDTFVDEKDESDRIPLQDDFIRALQTQFRFVVNDILKATYKISVSSDYISQRKKEGVDYGKLIIKYALEDIFDNAVRTTVGGRRYDDIVAAKTSISTKTPEKGEAAKAMKSILEKMIEYRADMDVAPFGVNVTGITTSGIKSSIETEEARRGVQIEAMTARKQVETTKREVQKIETRKAVKEQDFIDGEAAGGKEERTLKGIIRGGISPSEAASIRNTQILADALSKTKSPIVVLGTDSNSASRGVLFGAGASRVQQGEISEDKTQEEQKQKPEEKETKSQQKNNKR